MSTPSSSARNRGIHGARRVSLLALAAGALLNTTANAQVPASTSTFFVRAGAFFPKIETVVRADGKNGLIGTSIDFESDLGLEDTKTLPVFDAAWRFSPNHRIEFNYLNSSRDSTATLQRDLTWNGEVYPVNAQVRSEFDARIAALSYLYSLYRTADTELALGIGLHTVKLSAGLDVQGTSLQRSGSISATAPLPVIAVRGSTRIVGNVSAELRYQWFGISVGDYSGSLNAVNFAVSWYPWRSATDAWKGLGFEAGYNYYRYDLEASRERWNGEAKYEFKGPMIAVVGAF